MVSASVTAFLFGGITSSGSTILVQLLHGLGWNLTVSVCAVQALTDYLDRFACLALAAVLVRALPAPFRMIKKNGGKHRGAL